MTAPTAVVANGTPRVTRRRVATRRLATPNRGDRARGAFLRRRSWSPASALRETDRRCESRFNRRHRPSGWVLDLIDAA
jgi:hypothetical protein